VYLLIAKILAPIALLAGLWFWHSSTVSGADKAGYARAIAEWRKSDEIAVAVGNETTAILKRGAVANEGKLNAQLADMAKRNAAVAADNLSVRNTLATIAAAPTHDPTPGPACRSYERQFRECSGLLAEGVGLAEEGGRLALETSTKLGALQDWAGIVQSSGK
jgi:hypothetical protein